MKVYALQSNACETPYKSYIRLFGVFDNMELAKKKAIELGLPIYLITEIEMSRDLDKPTEIYLGGYFEE